MKESEGIILVIVFSSFLLVLAVSFFLLFNNYHKNLRLRQREAMNNLIIGQNNERERIARDLHDDMGLKLASIHLSMDEIKSDEPGVIEAKHRTKIKLLEVSEEIRQISHDLMPMSLARYGLVESIMELKEKYESKISIDFSTNFENIKFTNTIESHLYRIVKELIQNTLKHSGADNVSLDLKFNSSKKQIGLEYCDNGRGCENTKEVINGMGLKNIKTRVELMNGIIKIDGSNGFKASIIISTNPNNYR